MGMSLDVLLIEPNHRSGMNPFPWGVLSLGSYLRSQGVRVELVAGSYLLAEQFDAELDRLLPEAPVVGIGCFSTDTAFVKRLVDSIRQRYPDKVIVVGGPHAILCPESVAGYGNIDFATTGPGEVPLLKLVRKIREGATDFSDVPGLCYTDNGRLVTTPADTDVPDYSIDYSLLPEKKTRTMGRYSEYLAGRGCSFKCAFCYNAVCGHKWQGKDIKVMMDELGELVDAYDPDYIYFRDENFFHSKKRIRAFVKEYRARGFRFVWDATCRANYFTRGYVNREFIKELEGVNCQRLKFGIESGSQRVLNLLKKGTKIEQIRNVVELLSESSIIGNYSFLMGIPGESEREYADTMSLIRLILDTDPTAEIIGPQYYRIYPGGELYDHIKERYDFKEPETFEEWAKTVEDDYFGLNKNFDYPWVPNPNLPRLADMLVLLRRKPIRDLLTPIKAPAIPFVLLARLRMRLGWYGWLYDMKLAAYLFKRYVKSFYIPRNLSND